MPVFDKEMYELNAKCRKKLVGAFCGNDERIIQAVKNSMQIGKSQRHELISALVHHCENGNWDYFSLIADELNSRCATLEPENFQPQFLSGK